MADSKPTAPADPVSKLAAAAVALHELYTEYQRAGFTRAEAMELVKVIVTKPAP
ncbi:hypothetical protein ACWEFL_15820 [Streptomyces sp. NPDC004838]